MKNDTDTIWWVRLVLWGAIVFGALILLFAGYYLYEAKRFSGVQVVFLDVGQGDAILISEGSYQILVDGGPDGRKLLEEVGYHTPFWDRKIEMVIATHPDKDHIDGLVDLVQKYEVGEFWMSTIERDTSVYAALLRNLRNRDIPVKFPEQGWGVTLPSGGHLEVIYPFVKSEAVMLSHEPNNASITTTFAVGEEVFFLGGDLHLEVEDLLAVGEEITVLKVGHHGSGTSTSENFLNKTTPRDAVFSFGSGNRYGHPKDEVVERVERMVENIYETAEEGSIVYKCSNYCSR